MKKIVFFALAAVMMLALMPNVFAAEDYGQVRDITEEAGDSLSSGKGSLETKGNTTIIRYGTSTFKMLESDDSATDGARPGPAAWIGFEITEPTSDNDSQFKVTTPDGKTTEIRNSFYKDYVGITPNNLKKALLNSTVLTYKYSFDWDEDGTDEQYVIIEIDPEKTTLMPSDGGDSVWSPEIAQGILKQENPTTSDINLFSVLGFLVVGGLGLVYCLKKA